VHNPCATRLVLLLSASCVSMTTRVLCKQRHHTAYTGTMHSSFYKQSRNAPPTALAYKEEDGVVEPAWIQAGNAAP